MFAFLPFSHAHVCGSLLPDFPYSDEMSLFLRDTSLVSLEDIPLQIVMGSDDEGSGMGSDGEEGSEVVNNLVQGSAVSNSNPATDIGVSIKDTALIMDGVGGNNQILETDFHSLIVDKKDLQVYSFNRQLKAIVTKEVKKPGRNFDRLFQQLTSIRGGVKVRLEFIQDIIHEAKRFKRRSLVADLERFSLSISNNKSGVKHVLKNTFS